MEQGKVIESAMTSTSISARNTHTAFQQLPASVRSITDKAPFRVDVSDSLKQLQRQALAQIRNTPSDH